MLSLANGKLLLCPLLQLLVGFIDGAILGVAD